MASMSYEGNRADSTGTRSIAAQVVLFGAAYFLCAYLSAFLSPPDLPYVSFWLPSGLFLAMLLLHPPRRWPGFVVAAFVANVAFDLHNGQQLTTALLFAAGSGVDALLGAVLVLSLIHI